MTAKHTGLGQPMAPPGETPATPLSPAFFARDTSRVARELLGQLLVRRLDATTIVARIVETEAYLGAEDRASHAWAGRRSARNAALYLPAGTAYVYFIYGMHFCLNVVANTDGGGGAVLFRAAEVVAGHDEVRRRRGFVDREPRSGDLLGGPGRLCRGLGVDRGFDGLPFAGGGLELVAAPPVADPAVAVAPRVGIAYAGTAAAWPLRFALRGHRDVSRPQLR